MYGAEAILPVLVPNVTPMPGNSSQLMLKLGHNVTINDALRQSVVDIHHAKDRPTKQIAMESACVNVIIQ